MACRDSQLLITDLIDGRRLSGEEIRTLCEHVAACSTCANAWGEMQAVKSLLSRRSLRHNIPQSTLHGIRATIAREAKRNSAKGRSNPQPPRLGLLGMLSDGSLAVHALFDMMVVCEADTADSESKFNEGSDAYIANNLALFERICDGTQELQIKTSDEQKLKQFFYSQGITTDVMIQQIPSAKLRGGFISNYSETLLAHIVYQHPEGLMCLTEMPIMGALPENKLAISSTARQILNEGLSYWYFDSGHKNAVRLWKRNNNLCSITSVCKPMEAVSQLTLVA